MKTFEKIALRNDAGFIRPEKLAMLKRVYVVSCDEAKIPVDAVARRHALAESLMSASGIIDDEELLMIFARKALADNRS